MWLLAILLGCGDRCDEPDLTGDYEVHRVAQESGPALEGLVGATVVVADDVATITYIDDGHTVTVRYRIEYPE